MKPTDEQLSDLQLMAEWAPEEFCSISWTKRHQAALKAILAGYRLCREIVDNIDELRADGSVELYKDHYCSPSVQSFVRTHQLGCHAKHWTGPDVPTCLRDAVKAKRAAEQTKGTENQ